MTGMAIADISMDRKEFAQLMLKWGDLREELDDIEEVIAAEVMRMGESVEIGYTLAQYSSGRATYGWEDEARKEGASEALIEACSTIKVTTKWKEVCGEMGIEDAPVVKEGVPKVTFKLVK